MSTKTIGNSPGGIGSFTRVVKRSLEECEAIESDTLFQWENKDGVVVSIEVEKYPRYEKVSKNGSVQIERVVEYHICIEGSDDLDGRGPDAPFESVYTQVRKARFGATEQLRKIAGDRSDWNGA